MCRAGPAHGDGQPGRLEHRTGITAHQGIELGQGIADVSASKTASSWRPNNSGNTRFTITPASCTVVSSRTLTANSIVSVTGISSGVHTARRPVIAGSDNISSIHSVWVRISPTLTSPLTACGAAS